MNFAVRSSRGTVDVEALRLCTSPHQLNVVDRVGSVQNRRLRLEGGKLGYGYREVPLLEPCEWHGMEALAKRRG